MCEPLQGKELTCHCHERPKGTPIKVFDVKDIKSAVNFYKKYKGKPMDLEREQKEAYLSWTKHKQDNYISTFDLKSVWWGVQIFNDWLFNYTFKDAIE